MITYVPHTIPGLFLGRSAATSDHRGSDVRTFDARALVAAGGPSLAWVEVMMSRSRRACVRGLHLRRDTGQWKQIRVGRGSIFDVVVDLRPSSATFLAVVPVALVAGHRDQAVVPPGCAHGFQVLTDDAEVTFASSLPADASLEAGIRYDDPTLAIPWPLTGPRLSERDSTLPPLSEVLPRLERDFVGIQTP